MFRSMLVVLLLALAVPAHAQEDPADEARARELYQNGALLYDEGRYEDAIVAWQEAYDLSERPELLFNIASAQERLGLWRDALETLNRYRVYAPAGERDSMKRRISNIERRLAEEAASPPAEPATTTPPEAVTTTTTTTTAAPRERRWLPVVGLGVGAAGLVTGTASALRAQEARDEAAASCVDALCLSDAAPAVSRDQRSSLIADGAFLVGGAALIGGVVVLVATDRGPQLSVVPGGLRLSGTF